MSQLHQPVGDEATLQKLRVYDSTTATAVTPPATETCTNVLATTPSTSSRVSPTETPRMQSNYGTSINSYTHITAVTPPTTQTCTNALTTTPSTSFRVFTPRIQLNSLDPQWDGCQARTVEGTVVITKAPNGCLCMNYNRSVCAPILRT